MNDEKGGDCYFHPKEVVVGVCPLCLYERLFVLAAKQGGSLNQTKGSRNLRSRSFTQRANTSNNHKPPIVRPKIFALSSLLNRFEFRHHRKSDNLDTCSSISQDDSFISIQFGNNGDPSWEKGKVSKVSLDHCNMAWNQNLSKGATKEDKIVIEHLKPRASSLRWRKRIGHLFQVMRWKKCNKGSVCHVGGKMEGVKVRNGWIRALTKRKTKE